MSFPVKNDDGDVVATAIFIDTDRVEMFFSSSVDELSGAGQRPLWRAILRAMDAAELTELQRRAFMQQFSSLTAAFLHGLYDAEKVVFG